VEEIDYFCAKGKIMHVAMQVVLNHDKADASELSTFCCTHKRFLWSTVWAQNRVNCCALCFQKAIFKPITCTRQPSFLVDTS